MAGKRNLLREVEAYFDVHSSGKRKGGIISPKPRVEHPPRPRGGPPWALDPEIWAAAEAEVDPTGTGKSKYDDPWAVVSTVYKSMGGRVKHRRSTHR